MNVSSLLAEQAANRPDANALIFRSRPVTYAQLDDAAGRACAAFVASGVQPGDRVALMVGNVPEFVSALYGIWRAGAVAVPLNVMLTSEEVGYMLADAGVRAVVTQMGELPTILAVRDRLSELDTVFVVAGPPVPPRTVSYEHAMGRHQPIREATDSPDGLALIQYTSGTTADPRGAMLGHDNLFANMDQMEQVPSMKILSDDVVLLVLPLFHIYALNVILGMSVRGGGTAVLVERFEPGEALGLIEREEGEGGLADVEEGDPGEILVRGPNVFRGYWRKEDATAATLADGWLRTGDVAYRDEDGYLFLVDRTKDLIIVSGFNVFPKEVEEALARLPGVSEAAVIGIPDPRTGEAVKAMVVLDEGATATPESLADGVSRFLARFKIPRVIEIVSEIPRHPTGKILRRALRGEDVLGGTGDGGPSTGPRPPGTGARP